MGVNTDYYIFFIIKAPISTTQAYIFIQQDPIDMYIYIYLYIHTYSPYCSTQGQIHPLILRHNHLHMWVYNIYIYTSPFHDNRIPYINLHGHIYIHIYTSAIYISSHNLSLSTSPLNSQLCRSIFTSTLHPKTVYMTTYNYILTPRFS